MSVPELPRRTVTVHCKRSGYDVYIGRPGPWGNPFTIGRDGTRQEVIRKYEEHLLASHALLELVPELAGMTLGCWCSPRPCHGDVLARYANDPALLAAALLDAP